MGKALAGKLVRVETAPDGIMLRFVVDVPEQDAWWTQEPYKTKLKSALAWAGEHPPAATDLDALLARVTPPVVPATTKGAKKGKPSKRAARRKQMATAQPILRRSTVTSDLLSAVVEVC